MGRLDLNSLKNNKNEILKAEIGALLFNLGKTHIGFWREKNGKIYFTLDKTLFFQNFGFEPFKRYKEYYKTDKTLGKSPFEYELEKTDLKLKDFVFSEEVNFPFSIENGKCKIKWSNFFKGDALEDGEEGRNFIQKIFFRGCENINSGIDKGSPQDINQLKKPLWLSNAFGSFKREIKEDNFDKSRLCFLQKLHEYLEDNNYYSIPDWKRINLWIKNEIKSWYSKLLSDSRFPVNDVSLRDQAYMTSSMFKATLAGLHLDNSNYQKYINDPQSIRWSILSIQYDKLGLAEKGLKPGFIAWYRDKAREVDDKIKTLLEVDYPIGNEVYRDETGIYFVVGESLIGDPDGDFYRLHENLKDVKDKIIEKFKKNFQEEVYPAIFLTKPSRGLMNLGYLVEKARENFLKAEIPEDFGKEIKHDTTSQGICQVCKLRLANKKNKDELICKVCSDRSRGRLEEWLNNRQNETIWMGELQDKNGKVALVTLKFELEQWINGNLVNSLVVQNFDLNRKTYEDYFNNSLNDIKSDKNIKDTILKHYHTNIPNLKLKELVEKWLLERSIGSVWEKFITDNLSSPYLIDFEKRKINWNKFTNEDYKFITALFLQFLLRKNPSPARLKRIWDTTKEFLNQINSKIICLLNIPQERQKRYYWEKVDLEDGEYKDGEFDFWVKDGIVYLITYIKDVRDKKFNLKRYENNEPTGVTLDIDDALSETYKPVLSIIDPTPISWQFAIPAEYIPNLIEKIKEEYNKHFKYVYGKLPLHIGVIIQDYKKPLYIGIQALRKIRRDKVNWEDLRKEIERKDLKSIQDEILNSAPGEEKDNNTEDFYSYYELKSGEGKYNFYIYPKPDGKYWIATVKDKNDEDVFCVYPNTFDFEFLDSNIRRNDIYYKKDKRANKWKKLRPFCLHDWQYFQKFREYFSSTRRSSSKLQKLISIIYSKLDDWDDNEALRQFMISTFINILELGKGNKDEFVNILGVDSFEDLKEVPPEEFREKLLMLIDMFEFWHVTLKEV